MRNPVAWPPILLIAIPALVSPIVMLGWWLQIDALVQLNPAWVPMQFNTALCILLSAVSLFQYTKAKFFSSILLSSFVVLIAASTLIEYIAGIDFGIDQLFSSYYIETRTPYPGRMGANTALSFLIFNIGLIVQSRFRQQHLVFTIAGALTLGLSSIALFGYLTGLVPATGWGNLSGMALHTALGFVLLSLAVLLMARSRLTTLPQFKEYIITLLSGVSITAIICLYFALQTEYERNVQTLLDNETRLLEKTFEAEVGHLYSLQTRLVDSLNRQSITIEELTSKELFSDAFGEVQGFVALLNVDANRTINFIANKNDLEITDISDVFNDEIMADDGIVFQRIRIKNNEYIAALSNWGAATSLQTLITVYSPLALSGEQKNLVINNVLIDESLIYENTEKFNSDFVELMNEYVFLNKKWEIVITRINDLDVAQSKPLQRVIFYILAAVVLTFVFLVYLLVQSESRRQLEKLSNRLAKTFDAMIDGLVVVDNKGQIIDVNQGLLDMFGYSSEELISNNISLLMPINYGQQHDDLMARYKDATSSTIIGQQRVFIGVRKNGDEFPLRLSVTTYEDDNKRYFIGVIHDLSELADNKELLYEKESILNAAMESSGASIAILNPQLNITQANRTLADWLGYSMDEVMGLNLEKLIAEKDAAQLRDDLTYLSTDNKSNRHHEYQFINKSGEYFWGLMSVSLVKEEQAIKYVVVNILDITATKDLERDLQRQNAALASANSELEQFAYVASHDLKEPLRTVKTFSEYLLKDLETNDQERIEQDVGFIQSACVKMTQLVEDLLQLSKASHSQLNIEDCDFNSITNDLQERLATLIADKQATITRDFAVSTIEADRSQLLILLQNLIQNALKFSRDDVPSVINISTQVNNGGLVEIKIRDNGIGIASEHFDQVFGVFKRLHGSGRYEGTGIGLAIVAKIVARHDGKIEIESTLDVGTSFIISLPLNQIAH